jgi:glycosyltransferase involved in cell wall biosynthesis
MSRRRVLHVVESYGGGVASAINSYVDATPQVEHHAVVQLREADYQPDGELARFASVTELGTGLAAFRSIRRAADRIRPDVVHAHSSYGGLYTRTALRSRSDRRILYTPHCFAFERQDVLPAVRRAFRLVEGVLTRWNTAEVVACSPREARLASQLASSVPATFVPNVVPDDALNVSPAGAESLPKRLVGVGRLGAQKDPTYFAAVVQQVRRHMDVEAVWLGDGDPLLRSLLESRDIQVTGWMPRSKVYARLAEGGVYVHSALWEGFPMAILEAHHFGLPIAARAVGPLEHIPAYLGHASSGGTASVVTELLESVNERRANVAGWSDFLANSTRESQSDLLGALYDIRSAALDRSTA